MKKILNFDYPEASRRGIRQNFSDQKDRKPDFLGDGAFSKQHIIDPEAEPSENSQIKYPTDLNLLNESRENLERMIDLLHKILGWNKKPRTYRRKEGKKTISECIKEEKQVYQNIASLDKGTTPICSS